MKDAARGQISRLNYEESEIDLCQFIKLLAKHKKAFGGVFLFVFGIGFWLLLTYPEIYRSSVLLQSPSFSEVLTEADGFKSAQDLKSMILDNYFNDVLRAKLNLGPNNNYLKFDVAILNKTDILRISIDRESKEKESGVVILQNLVERIPENYVKYIEARKESIRSQIRFNEAGILSARKEVKNLAEHVRVEIAEEDQLRGQKKYINAITARLIEKRKGLLKSKAAVKGTAALLLVNQIQNNSNYLKWVDGQLGELSLRETHLDLELKKINAKINNFQKEIDSLNISQEHIPRLRIISQPKISPVPIKSKKNKTLGLFLVMGVFSGALAVLLQEFWMSKFKKHD